jgi:hypothetical protein
MDQIKIMLHARYVNAVVDLIESWEDEAAEHALNKNPRRADYLEWMAGRLRNGQLGIQP